MVQFSFIAQRSWRKARNHSKCYSDKTNKNKSVQMETFQIACMDTNEVVEVRLESWFVRLPVSLNVTPTSNQILFSNNREYSWSTFSLSTNPKYNSALGRQPLLIGKFWKLKVLEED